jgi:hypothetical protein
MIGARLVDSHFPTCDLILSAKATMFKAENAVQYLPKNPASLEVFDGIDCGIAH